MKKTLIMALLTLAVISTAAEFTPDKTSAREKSGTRQVILHPKYGLILLRNNNEEVCRGGLQIGTKAGYSGWENAQNAFSNPEQGVWQFSGTFPVNSNKDPLKITECIELTPMGTFDISLNFETKFPADNRDTFMHFSAASYEGKKLLINNKEHAVPAANRYGFVFLTNQENPTVVFYQWDPAKRFQISVSGEGTIVAASSNQGKNIMVRFYPAARQNELKLNLKFQ